MIVINKQEEIEKYYNGETNTYVFNDDVTFTCDIQAGSSIDAYDIIANNIVANDIIADNIHAQNIIANNIHAHDIIAWDIDAQNIMATNVISDNEIEFSKIEFKRRINMENKMENKKNIFEALNSIMQEGVIVEKIKKSQQGYNYRGVDQVLNELQPLFAKHGVFVVPTVIDITREERTTTKGSLVIYTIIKMKYTFYATDGSFVESVVVGEAMDSGDKSCNKCMSVAFKYACFQVLCVPTEETTQDSDDSCEKLAPKKSVPKESEPKRAVPKIEFITAEQQEEFRKICILNKIDSEKLLKACKIENIEKMQVSTFNKIKSSISTLVEKYPAE